MLKPVSIAEYAYRELLIGRVGLLCDAHNKVVASSNVMEVIASFIKQASFARTPVAKAQEILKPLQTMFDSASPVSPVDARRQVAEELMSIATKLWKRAARFPGASKVQPLPCLVHGDIVLDKNGILRGPNDTFNCSKDWVCGAATYMYNDRGQLQKMIEALESPTLSAQLRVKGETISRRKVLKLLESRGPRAITRAKCRQLGDAYFAAMCPPGADVVTTNDVDFAPLCAAIGKTVVRP